jgi:hypothetical protein
MICMFVCIYDLYDLYVCMHACMYICVCMHLYIIYVDIHRNVFKDLFTTDILVSICMKTSHKFL